MHQARHTLLTDVDLLTGTQAKRLEDLFADKHHAAVQATWGLYRRLIQASRVEDPGLGKHLMRRLISSLRQTVSDGLEKITELARTQICR